VPVAAPPLPPRRSDLRVEPFGEKGEHVVKDPRSGDFFLLGQREHFLLLQLDGEHSATAVRSAYERRFEEPLTPGDLDDFLVTAGEQGMLATSAPPAAPAKQSLLFFRKSLFDPDRLFTRIEPKLRWIWTKTFLVLSAVAIAGGGMLLFANRDDLVASLRDSLRWESLLVGWFVVALLGVLHECSHGLTCKHFGGAVHEIGALFLYFTPCFYCNVSDAWLFKEKRKRVWVMLAGGHCDLLVWALAVVLWRVAEPGTFMSRVSFLVVGISGLDTLSNFNPLLKLDGYYLLSDWKELPNLRQRALERAGAHARRVLWGAAPPVADTSGRFLTAFGLLTWLFSATFLVAAVTIGARWLHEVGGAAGYVAAVLLALPAVLASIRGISGGEVTRMITKRRIRAFCWLLALVGLGAASVFWRVDEYSGGSFTVRPAVHAEVRAPVAGFLRAVAAQEGDRVGAGDLVARLEVPDLDCRIEQKRAELREAKAQLSLLETGTRPEEIVEQRGRVARAGRWRDLAADELTRMRNALTEELAAFEQRLAEAQVQVEASDLRHDRIAKLADDGLVSREELESADQARRIARARRSVVQAEKRARESSGTIEGEVELARRERELGDETSRLALLEAGARPEELAAQRARVERLGVEQDHLEALQRRLEVASPVAGAIVTPRLRERVGQYLREGDPICVVEEHSAPVAEIALDEEKLRGIELGQRVAFKIRALPFTTLEGRVVRLASCAAREDGRAQGTVLVHCSIDGAPPLLRTATSGYARIYTGERPVGAVVLDAALRLFRTEFWW